MLFTGGDRRLPNRKNAGRVGGPFGSFGASSKQRSGRNGLASVKRQRRARDAARRDERQQHAAESKKNRAATVLQSCARSWLARQSLFWTRQARCQAFLSTDLPEPSALLRSIMWCQRFAGASPKRDGALQNAADGLLVLFAHRMSSSSKTTLLASKLAPDHLKILFLQTCIRLLKRSQNLDVMPVLEQMLDEPLCTPNFCADIIVGCVSSAFDAGLLVGLNTTAGGVVCRIVARALKHRATLQIIAPYYLAKWLSKQGTRVTADFSTYGVQPSCLLQYIQDAEAIIGNDAAAAHVLASNLLEIFPIDDSIIRSFNLHARGLFWKVAVDAMEQGLNSVGDTAEIRQHFLAQYGIDDANDESYIDTEDEFSLLQSQRVYAAVCHHHQQITSQAFKLVENDDEDNTSKRGLISRYLLDSEKWLRLAEEDISKDEPMLNWSIPLAILIARHGSHPNATKVLEDLRPAKKTKLEHKSNESNEQNSLPAVPRLMRLFPHVEEDVCALVYTNSDRSFERAVEAISNMTGLNPIRPPFDVEGSGREPDSSRLTRNELFGPLALSLASKLPLVSLWDALNKCYGYGAMRIAGDRSLRKAFPSTYYACFIFVTLLFEQLSVLDNDAFDDPENHYLARGTHLSDVVVFLQILIGSFQEKDEDMKLDPLTPYVLNACCALYCILVYHHKRKPWIRNTSDIIDADMKVALDADRRLRAEQDADFAAALEHDKSEAEKAQEIQDAEAAKLEEERQALLSQEEKVLRWKELLKDKQEQVKLKQDLLSKNRSEDIVAIRLRFPSGKAQTLRLLASEKLSLVFDFVDVHLDSECPAAFDLVRTHPQRIFSRSNHIEIGTMLSELELSRATLLIKMLDA